MRNIREWFGNSVQYDLNSQFNSALDKLLIIFKKAIYSYLNCSQDVDDIQMLFIRLNGKLNPSQRRFLEWFEMIGLKKIQTLCQLISVNNESKIVHEIEYYIYMLEEELNEDETNELRANLVNISNDLPLLINELNNQEISATIEKASQLEEAYHYISSIMDTIMVWLDTNSVSDDYNSEYEYQTFRTVVTTGLASESVYMKPQEASFFV